jgi:hypothetical protein
MQPNRLLQSQQTQNKRMPQVHNAELTLVQFSIPDDLKHALGKPANSQTMIMIKLKELAIALV